MADVHPTTQQQEPTPEQHMPISRPSRLYRIGYGSATHPWPIIGAWLLFFLVSLLLLPRFLQGLSGLPLDVTGAESQRMQQTLRQQFSRAFTEQDVIVFESKTLTIRDAVYQRVITQAVQQVSRVSGVADVISPLDPQASGQISADGHAAAALIGIRGSDDARLQLAPRLMQAAQSAATGSVSISVTGESEIMADMTAQETEDIALAERIGLPIALLVLLLAFGSLVAAGIPLLLAAIGVTVTMGVLSIAASITRFDLFVETVVSMIGLGVGIDYSMFLVTRYREELGRQTNVQEAVAATFATSGKAIFFSGMTVLLSLSGLLLVNMKLFIDMAIAAMITVGVTMAVALTLLPAVLGLLGHRINRLALPFLQRGGEHPDPESGFWARWVRGIMHHPAVWTLLAVSILLVFTLPVAQLKLGIDLGTNSLRERPSGQGVAVLERYFSPGAVSPIQILVESSHGSLNDQDLNVVARLTKELQLNRDVLRVDSVTTLLDQIGGNHSMATLRAVAAQPQMAGYLAYMVNVQQGTTVTILSVVPRVAVDSNTATHFVEVLRQTLIPQARGNVPVTILVGGLTAQIVDMSVESTNKLPLVVGTVLLLSFVLLTLVFRSLFLPLKAILLNLLSVGAAYGLLVLIFQEGRGAHLFHFTPVGNVQVFLPLLTFALLFGLSMDYEVFLIGRMKEEWEHTHVNEKAVARGLQHSARAITSAAAIMVAVFAAFAFTRMLEIQEMGFALAVAVLVDATIIRILLVPAAMRLMGHWNWWFPHWLERWVPRIDLGEGAKSNLDNQGTAKHVAP